MQVSKVNHLNVAVPLQAIESTVIAKKDEDTITAAGPSSKSNFFSTLFEFGKTCMKVAVNVLTNGKDYVVKWFNKDKELTFRERLEKQQEKVKESALSAAAKILFFLELMDLAEEKSEEKDAPTKEERETIVKQAFGFLPQFLQEEIRKQIWIQDGAKSPDPLYGADQIEKAPLSSKVRLAVNVVSERFPSVRIHAIEKQILSGETSNLDKVKLFQELIEMKSTDHDDYSEKEIKRSIRVIFCKLPERAQDHILLKLSEELMRQGRGSSEAFFAKRFLIEQPRSDEVKEAVKRVLLSFPSRIVISKLHVISDEYVNPRVKVLAFHSIVHALENNSLENYPFSKIEEAAREGFKLLPLDIQKELKHEIYNSHQKVGFSTSEIDFAGRIIETNPCSAIVRQAISIWLQNHPGDL